MVQGLGFGPRVEGFGLRVEGFRFSFWRLVFRVEGLGFRNSSSGLKV